MTDRTLPTKGHASRVMPPPGPEMDALVAEALGYSDRKVAAGVPPFSGYSAAAMRALETWREHHPDWTGQIILPYGEHRYYEVQLWPVPERYGDGWECLAKSKMLEAAICEVIIRAHWALEDAR